MVMAKRRVISGQGSPSNITTKPMKKSTAPKKIAAKKAVKKPLQKASKSPVKKVSKKKAVSKPVNKTNKKVVKKSSPSKRQVSGRPSKFIRESQARAKKKPHKNEDEVKVWPIILSIILFVGVLGIVIWINAQADVTPKSPVDKFDFDPADIKTFPDVMVKIDIIDLHYVTDYRKERLGKDMIRPALIPGYLEKLDLLSVAINNSDTNESEIINNFMEARYRMLHSQDYFQQALKYGMLGVVSQDFQCGQTKVLMEATVLFNQSFEVGRFAIPRLDHVLADSKPAREILGLNTEKMRWFVNRFGDIKRLIDTNLWAIDTLCVKKKPLIKQPHVKMPDIDLPGIRFI